MPQKFQRSFRCGYRSSLFTRRPAPCFCIKGQYSQALGLKDRSVAQRITLKGHLGGVNAVTLLPDGQLLASASRDDTVRPWEVRTMEEVQILSTEESIYDLSFSSDGSYLKTERGLFELSCLYRSVGQPQSDFSLYRTSMSQSNGWLVEQKIFYGFLPIIDRDY
jgi:WD40 repeat protein